MTLRYVVTVPSELAAGLRGFHEEVSISFAYTDKAVDDTDSRNDLIEHFRTSLAEWFDVSTKQVSTEEEYAAMVREEQ